MEDLSSRKGKKRVFDIKKDEMVPRNLPLKEKEKEEGKKGRKITFRPGCKPKRKGVRKRAQCPYLETQKVAPTEGEDHVCVRSAQKEKKMSKEREKALTVPDQLVSSLGGKK